MTTPAVAGARRGRRALRAVTITAAITVAVLLALVAVLAVAVFAFYRPPLEPFDPVVWHPPDAVTIAPDLVDPLSSRQIRPLIEESIPGPEDVAVDAVGAVYVGTSNGAIRRILPGRTSSELGRPYGRLLRYNPADRTTTEVRRDLYFPNGLVLTADQNAVLIAESTRFRITKHWIKGERSGASETFLDAVPGVLDGVTRQGRHLLLPMYDRPSLLDDLVLPSAFAREAAIRLASVLFTGNDDPDDDPLAGSILVLTENGDVIRHITGIPPAPSNIALHDNTWLLGTLSRHQVREMPNPLPRH